MNLPPLPEPFINLDNTPRAKLAWGAQMLAYGEARAEHARKQALEEAAQCVERMTVGNTPLTTVMGAIGNEIRSLIK